MKYDPNQHWKEKIANLKRLAESVSARNKPFTVSVLTEETRERIEDVTRFEQFRGLVLKQCGNRQRELNFETIR